MTSEIPNKIMQRARSLSRVGCGCHEDNFATCQSFRDGYCQREYEHIARALMAERNAALEDAAKVADANDSGGCPCNGHGCLCGNYDDAGSAGYADAARTIATAIRKMKVKADD